MNIGLFFDSESTGIPIWNRPSGTAMQPHIVQLAAILVDLDTKKILQSIFLIKIAIWLLLFPKKAQAVS